MTKLLKNYFSLLKQEHFFLLLAIATSFIHSSIQAFLYTILFLIRGDDSFIQIFLNIIRGIIAYFLPFIIIWLISYFATLTSKYIPLLTKIITFLLNVLIIIFVQFLFGYSLIVFVIVY